MRARILLLPALALVAATGSAIASPWTGPGYYLVEPADGADKAKFVLGPFKEKSRCELMAGIYGGDDTELDCTWFYDKPNDVEE